MPFTTWASKAFPSSSSSSTLSESAPSRFDRPCRSPDWPPERAPSPVGWNTTVSALSLLPRTLFFLSTFFFFAAAFLAGAALFAVIFLRAGFWARVFLDLVGFVFFLFLVAMPWSLSREDGAYIRLAKPRRNL